MLDLLSSGQIDDFSGIIDCDDLVQEAEGLVARGYRAP